MSHRLLLVHEGSRPLLPLVQSLRGRGYILRTVPSSRLLHEIAIAAAFDLVLIDAKHLQKGLALCTGLRQAGCLDAVVILGPRTDVNDRVAAFRAGADDYLMRPVDLDELHARIEAMLRRARIESHAEAIHSFGGIVVNFSKARIDKGGTSITLSERESRLLQYFVERRGKIVSRDALLRDVWGYERPPFTRTVDVHILRLRRKVEHDPKHPQFIVTIPGLGYRFDG